VKKYLAFIMGGAAALVLAMACAQQDGGGAPAEDKPINPNAPKYSVNVENVEGSGGVISASTTKAQAGASVTISVKADDGYVLSGLAYTYESGGKSSTVSNFSKGGGGWRFMMPAADVTVSAEFKEGSFTPSADATLKAIEISDAGAGGIIRLNETFSPGTTSYTANVPHTVAAINILASPNDFYAETSLKKGDAEPDHPVTLEYGVNNFTIEVSPSDGVSPSKSYTLAVTRRPNLDLASLKIVGQGTEGPALASWEKSAGADMSLRAYVKTVTNRSVKIIAVTDDPEAQFSNYGSGPQADDKQLTVTVEELSESGTYSTKHFSVSKEAGGSTYKDDYTISVCYSTNENGTGSGYNITLLNNYNGADNNEFKSVIVPLGEQARAYIEAAGAPVRPSYAFTAWYEDGAARAPFNLDTKLSGNKSLYAGWAFTSYKITFDPNGGSGGTTEKSVSGSNGGPDGALVGGLPQDKPKKTNALFDGWYTAANGGGEKVGASTPVTGNVTFYAKWIGVPSGWTYDGATGGMKKDFSYTGSAQTLTTPFGGGKYKFELWGANGGINYADVNSKAVRAKGGYAKGSIKNLEPNTALKVYVGGKGSDGAVNEKKSANDDNYRNGGVGGFNGGGKGGNGIWNKTYNYPGGGGGGGASDVRFTDALNTRVIVAGGGGGGGHNGKTGVLEVKGGAGGGVSGQKGYKLGNSSSYLQTDGGSQTSGNAFGFGGNGADAFDDNSSAEGRGGGGGGYWGGKGGDRYSGMNADNAGGGGSGFVYGYTSTPGVASGSNWIPATYQGYKFTSDFACTAGDVSNIPTNPVTNGHGHVRVSYVTSAMLE
jgi:uncharacterized repeat protein (TIGR02543 family)